MARVVLFAVGLATALPCFAATRAGAQPPPLPAQAEPPQPAEVAEQCVQAFGSAQRLKREGKLKARRAELIVCAQASCPEIVAAKCGEWLQDAAKAQPSVLLVVKDVGGDVVDFELTINGELVATELAGRALELDPGTHDIEVRRPSLGRSVKRKVVVSEGEQGRRVEIDFAPPRAPLKPPLRIAAETRSPFARVHPVTWVGFNMALVGATVGSVTGALALTRAADLEEACGGNVCSETQRGEYDEGVALAHASTASLVVAGVGAALGVITLPLLYDLKAAPPVRATAGPTFVSVEGRF